jgi:hypothetical protein
MQYGVRVFIAELFSVSALRHYRESTARFRGAVAVIFKLSVQ